MPTEIYKLFTDGYLTAILFPLVSTGQGGVSIRRVVVLIHRCFHSLCHVTFIPRLRNDYDAPGCSA